MYAYGWVLARCPFVFVAKRVSYCELYAWNSVSVFSYFALLQLAILSILEQYKMKIAVCKKVARSRKQRHALIVRRAGSLLA